MRLCTAKGINAIFHAWEQLSSPVPPSSMVGGHSGGELRNTYAIIEYEYNGQVTRVDPSDIIFRDTESVIETLTTKDIMAK